jgi:hypothetical protein
LKYKKNNNITNEYTYNPLSPLVKFIALLRLSKKEKKITANGNGANDRAYTSCSILKRGHTPSLRATSFNSGIRERMAQKAWRNNKGK